MERHPAIVIGCGGLGSAALYRLAARLGPGVLGIEQFELGHVRGGSQDHSRILRRVQHQREYAALAPAAYTAWREVEEASGQELVTVTGGLVIEDAAHRAKAGTGSRTLAGYTELLTEFGVDHEMLGAAEVTSRWPQFRLDGDEQALFQQDSAIVDAGRSMTTHLALARGLGAQILERTPVRAVVPTAGGVEVHTDQGVHLTEHLVVAAGAWTDQVLAGCGVQLPLTVTQEQVTYYRTRRPQDFSPEAFPVFMWHGEHNFYGFPIYGAGATKLGQHMGGPETTADTRTFEPDPVRRRRYRDFLDRHLPGFADAELATKTCLYTLPPDQHFVLGPVPGEPRIVVAVGAGHAFKFAALIGTILTELACDGASRHPVDAFALDRAALTDTAFAHAFHT